MEIEELCQFLSVDTRPDVRSLAMDYISGVAASQDCLVFFSTHSKILNAVIHLSFNDPEPVIRKEAYSCLINISVHDSLQQQFLDEEYLRALVEDIMNAEHPHPDGPVMILANITRNKEVAEKLGSMVMNDKPVPSLLLNVFAKSDNYNKNGSFHHLASVFLNLTQTEIGRSQVVSIDNHGIFLQKLLSFVESENIIRRGGIAGVIRNCCFDTQNHQWLLEDVGILPFILLPLAGPEEFDDEDMDGMPDDLQYLPPDKTREEDPDIRKMLLEAVQQLCAIRTSREFLKANKVYPILRELHNWEKEEDVKTQCEEVVQLLIRDESDMPDNIKAVDIPDEALKAIQSVNDTLAKGEGPEIEVVPTKEEQ